jgi:hypothetical protein
VHAVQWLRRWKRLGIFGEQIVESEHARANKWHGKWKNIRTWSNRIRLIEQRRSLTGYAPVQKRADEQHDAVKRKFSVTSATKAALKREEQSSAKKERKDDVVKKLSL